ncbi:MAG TPA: hypothetical protein VMD05_07755 [Candidatus Nanoarchaeia archaeon]|nr:hypothetical protein [Candidatus Nanoarchaeia archaeon]
MENYLISDFAPDVLNKKGGGKIERKTATLVLLLVVISAAVVAGLVVSAYAQTNSSSSTTFPTTSGAAPSFASLNSTDVPPSSLGIMTGDQGFGAGPGGMNGPGGRGNAFDRSMWSTEISAAYNQTISNILGNDTDVQKLVSEGYNLTSINPILSSTIGADGTLTTKASAAIVTMQDGTSGFATIKVDITNAKVTQIVIITKTVIDKSTTTSATS